MHGKNLIKPSTSSCQKACKWTHNTTDHVLLYRPHVLSFTAKETEDLGRPRKGGRSYSDSNLYCKARDEQFGESEREPVLSLENKKRFMDPEKEARVQSYLQNLGDELETHSLVTESSDSGIRTHGTPSDFDKMEDVSGKYNVLVLSQIFQNKVIYFKGR